MSLKLRISRMAQAPDAPQQEQIQALAAPQDTGQPAGQPAAQEPEVFIFFIPFSFLFCHRLLPRGSDLAASVERQFLHVYVSPFSL